MLTYSKYLPFSFYFSVLDNILESWEHTIKGLGSGITILPIILLREYSGLTVSIIQREIVYWMGVTIMLGITIYNNYSGHSSTRPYIPNIKDWNTNYSTAGRHKTCTKIRDNIEYTLMNI